MPSPYAYYGPPAYLLSLLLTGWQAEALMAQDQYRGYPNFRHAMHSVSYDRGTVYAEGIEVTEAEASQIASGTHPLDVLFPVWPEYGYRLVAKLADLRALDKALWAATCRKRPKSARRAAATTSRWSSPTAR
jgi:hypothetical protein